MPIDSTPFMQYGETPLHLAAKNGSAEAVKLLLKYNAFKEAKANVSFVLIKGTKNWLSTLWVTVLI